MFWLLAFFRVHASFMASPCKGKIISLQDGSLQSSVEFLLPKANKKGCAAQKSADHWALMWRCIVELDKLLCVLPLGSCSLICNLLGFGPHLSIILDLLSAWDEWLCWIWYSLDADKNRALCWMSWAALWIGESCFQAVFGMGCSKQTV